VGDPWKEGGKRLSYTKKVERSDTACSRSRRAYRRPVDLVKIFVQGINAVRLLFGKCATELFLDVPQTTMELRGIQIQTPLASSMIRSQEVKIPE